MNPSEWGGNLEVHLLAIGLKQDIVVIITVDHGEGNYAKRYPCALKPSQKMRECIFIP